MLEKYVLAAWYELVATTLWILHTHVFTGFRVSPRLALTSEDPDSGKTTLKDGCSYLVYRPSQESLGSGAAVYEFLDEGGAGTVLLDEVDNLEPEARKLLHQIFNLGHRYGARISRKERGRRRLIDIYGPMLVCGIEGFLIPTSLSRSIVLDMKPYTSETKPEREYDPHDVADLDNVYRYIRHCVPHMKFDLEPQMPAELLRREVDNWRPLISIADCCGPKWGKLARDAALAFSRKQHAARPHVTIVRHGLLIFDMLGADQIGSVEFNRQLRRLDLPDAKWTRYRGPSGTDYAHLLEMHEQAKLLEKSGIKSEPCWPPGPRRPRTGFRGYKRSAFEVALHKWQEQDDVEPGRSRLRLITFRSD